jgi:hypothetical protein
VTHFGITVLLHRNLFFKKDNLRPWYLFIFPVTRSAKLIWYGAWVYRSISLQRPKVGGFLPSRYATSSRKGEPSDRTLMTRIIHMPQILFSGTHSMFRRDPRGFMRYSCGTHIRWDPHILVCRAHNSIMGFMVKNLCFLILQAEKTLVTIFKIMYF